MTEEDITNFEKSYKGSAEEDQDLINFYNENKGDITKILENIILSSNDDAPRFVEKYTKWIEEKKIEHFKQFDTTKKKVKRLQDESKEIEEEDLKSLQTQILVRRTQQQASFLDMLEQKYSNQKPKKKQAKDPQPSQEKEGKNNKKLKK